MNVSENVYLLKSSLLWPNHMLSLVSFRRPALFIKALDGYLSQHCRIHPQKLPSLLSTLLLSNLFLLSSNVDSPSCLPLPAILLFPLSLIHPSLLNQTLKSPQFYSLCGCVCACVCVPVWMWQLMHERWVGGWMEADWRRAQIKGPRPVGKLLINKSKKLGQSGALLPSAADLWPVTPADATEPPWSEDFD